MLKELLQKARSECLQKQENTLSITVPDPVPVRPLLARIQVEKDAHFEQQQLSDEQMLQVQIIDARDALDRKRFYKRKEARGVFQLGTIVGSRGNLVDQLLKDNELQKYLKKRVAQVHERKTRRK